MIRSFADKRTAALFEGMSVKAIPTELRRRAKAKLAMIDAAVTLDFLRSPPGNRLEALGGNRTGQYSIRVNAQWRICFIWREDGVYGVEFTDYH